MDALLLLRNIKVENANAIAGLTWGFPAISGFLGFSHALQRRLQQKMVNAPRLQGCAVVCHDYQVHAHQPTPMSDHVFALTRNPLTKQGNTASFNEEGRMHMTVTLVIGVHDMPALDEDDLDELETTLYQLASLQRLCGGTIVTMQAAEIKTNASQYLENAALKGLMRSLLPGFALVSRDDVLVEHQQTSGLNSLDAWLDFSAITYQPTAKADEADKADWRMERPPYSGWLKPIMVGYRAISEVYAPGQVAKSRDAQTPVCFVESVYSIGQWLSPHRITELNHLFWYQTYQPEQGLYLCENNYQAALPELNTETE